MYAVFGKNNTLERPREFLVNKLAYDGYSSWFNL
jgi:hypothetical protein